MKHKVKQYKTTTGANLNRFDEVKSMQSNGIQQFENRSGNFAYRFYVECGRDAKSIRTSQ